MKTLAEQFTETDKQDWHTALQTASDMIFVKTYKEVPDFLKEKPSHGPLGIYSKEWLTDYFKDARGNTTYYGSLAPCDVMTIWKQKVEGINALRTHLAANKPPKVEEFWWSNKLNILKQCADNIKAQKPLYEKISKALAGRKFKATRYKSAADQIVEELNNIWTESPKIYGPAADYLRCILLRQTGYQWFR